MAFKRIINLTIKDPTTKNTLTLTGYKIEFDIVKTYQQATNPATIKVYNVLQATAEYLGKEGNTLIFSVGYEDDITRQLFSGDIVRSLYTWNGTDTVWEIEAYDSHFTLTNTYIGVSFSKGITISSVVSSIVDQLLATANTLGISLCKGNDIPSSDAKFNAGFSFHGRASEALSKVLAKIQYRWTIQEGHLLFLGPGVAAPTDVITISKQTGMLYAPEPLLSEAQKLGLPGVAQNPHRWKVKSLIIPQISAFSKVTLQSTVKSGTFLVETAHFSGDNWTGDFLLEMEMAEPSWFGVTE